ncbi:hypothetical protein [Halococcus hamelinensis]|uniref:Uncharacterized protein n=1 Tax=Halococcus hamelinensis 100A6 TaxID=1132509 RepID=M0LRE1_9EURY|nr:hypothetical protein [Halococcus hamelinensis]EMA36167.1 hypothetical protein C447_15381 [Halococcus hamelinensis 100A6]
MERRGYLARVGAVSIGGFALLAGCSGNGDGGDGNGSANGSDPGGGTPASGEDGEGGTAASGADGEDGSAASTPAESEGAGEILTTGDEALDTGQAPPSVTATQYENTATVPEVEGLETGQAPNAGGNNSSN